MNLYEMVDKQLERLAAMLESGLIVDDHYLQLHQQLIHVIEVTNSSD